MRRSNRVVSAGERILRVLLSASACQACHSTTDGESAAAAESIPATPNTPGPGGTTDTDTPATPGAASMDIDATGSVDAPGPTAQSMRNDANAAMPMAATQAAGAAGTAPGSTPSATAGAEAQAPAAGSPGQAAADSTGASAEVEAPTAARCAAMVAAADAFVDSLGDATLASDAVVPFEQHHNFAYEPQVASRPGVALSMLNESQQQKALALLQTGLSDEGMRKAETVRALENLKAVTLFQINMRDPSYYWFAIFGEPSEAGHWGWQVEGHHLSLHYTLKACAISDTPTFMGAWPSEVANAVDGGPPVGSRNLEQEEELGRALARSIDADPEKSARAFQSAAYRQMLPQGPDKAQPMMPEGLPASAMSATEQQQLRAIVEHYANAMAPELAAARLQRIEEHGGFDALSFVWTGSVEPKQRHFYRVQGPSFFIEYRNDDGNHIHSAWRDFTGDFGDDLP